MNPRKKAILSGIGSMLIPYIFLFLAGYGVMFDEVFYQEQFQKNGAYQEFGEEHVNAAVTEILTFYHTEQPITTEFFNEKEKRHLQDVKELYQKARAWWLGSLLAVVLVGSIIKDKKMIAAMLKRGAWITFILFVLLLPLLVTEFTHSFTRFHEMVFTNTDWMLNPETDNLILLFPESFFIALTWKTMQHILILVLVSYGVGKTLQRESCT